MRGEIAATKDGRITGLRVDVIADHGAFNATAQPTKYPAGFFHIFSGSYDLEAAHCKVKRRLHEQGAGRRGLPLLVPRDRGRLPRRAHGRRARAELEMDPAELRLKNFIRPEQFPYQSKTGWAYDSGDYETRDAQGMDIAGYDDLRREQAEKRARGELMGIGISFFTETVGAGPRKDMDILGLAMNDGAELRVHPTGKAVLGISAMSQGQGHETTFAQIVAEELGIPPEDIEVVNGDTDRTPYGLGTYGSRSTPCRARRRARRAQGARAARLIAAACWRPPDDLEWEKGRWFVKGDPEQGKTIQEIAMAAHGAVTCPRASRAPRGHRVYNPPNLTFPFGAYICVVDVDPGTGEVKVRRFIAVDDCGVRSTR